MKTFRVKMGFSSPWDSQRTRNQTYPGDTDSFVPLLTEV